MTKTNNGLPNLIEAQQRIAELGPPLSAGEIGALEALKPGAGAAPGGGAPRRGSYNPQTGKIEWAQ